MNNVILKKAVVYSKKRAPLTKFSVGNYITTDNILQNKKGVIEAINLPPNGTNVSAFDIGHILVANIRPYLKKIWYADRSGGCSADVLNFQVNESFDSKYVYYNMFRDDFFVHMMKGSKGSKMPRGDKEQVLNYIIPNYDINTQKKIASVLSALDTKIEINRKINTELDAMAKMLYDYWFVQFDFPDVNGKPYKSSGGKMLWSEELNREIPESWEVGELIDIANITMGQSPPGESYNEDGKGIVFYQGCTDFGNRFPTVRLYTTKPSRLAKEGDILLSVRAPVGALNIANENCCVGRGLAALNSKNSSMCYLYGVMVNLKNIFDRRNSDGTTFGAITKDDLFSLKVIKPQNNILHLYEKIIRPMFEKQNLIERENQKLSELRDWLLPMLMNGQVMVSADQDSEKIQLLKESLQEPISI